jgi:MarR family transcriptional regulator, organic hydroperoxide resistance regulator
MPLHRLLSRAGQEAERYSRRTIATHGLTATAMGVLGVLADTDDISHRELSGHLGVAPATLTPVVDALEAEGVVARERDPDDRRVVRLRITGRGRDRLADAHADVVSRLRTGLPQPAPEDAEIIRRYLLAVLAATTDAEAEIL